MPRWGPCEDQHPKQQAWIVTGIPGGFVATVNMPHDLSGYHSADAVRAQQAAIPTDEYQSAAAAAKAILIQRWLVGLAS